MPQNALQIGIRLGAPVELPAWLTEAAALDAAGADALFLPVPDDQDPYVLAGALAAVTYRVRLVLQLPEEPSERAVRTLREVSRDRVSVQAIDGWEPVEVPAGRAAWRAALAGAAERGAAGVVVPADPRLLDLLRNPDDEIDRRDLQLATG
jgi:alkanesulfonate monooxygenase SsuD/methylene tetrahydromethanopterin reductase-like flavin-dependent oxidoreductase (luciferase family)